MLLETPPLDSCGKFSLSVFGVCARCVPLFVVCFDLQSLLSFSVYFASVVLNFLTTNWLCLSLVCIAPPMHPLSKWYLDNMNFSVQFSLREHLSQCGKWILDLPLYYCWRSLLKPARLALKHATTHISCFFIEWDVIAEENWTQIHNVKEGYNFRWLRLDKVRNNWGEATLREPMLIRKLTLSLHWD